MGKEGWETKSTTEEKKGREEWRWPDVKEGQRNKMKTEVLRSSKIFEESQGKPGMILIADAALLLRALVLRAPHAYPVQVTMLTGTYLTVGND